MTWLDDGFWEEAFDIATQAQAFTTWLYLWLGIWAVRRAYHDLRATNDAEESRRARVGMLVTGLLLASFALAAIAITFSVLVPADVRTPVQAFWQRFAYFLSDQPAGVVLVVITVTRWRAFHGRV